jgi:hypothetical protein
MNSSSTGGQPSRSFRWGTIILLVIGCVALYSLYGMLYSPSNLTQTVLVSDPISVPPKTPLTSKDIPQPFEGGEYSFNTWVYVNNFRTNMNIRKAIFELKGASFSTLIVALGAQSNTLVVRTTNMDAGSAVNMKGDGILAATDMPGFFGKDGNAPPIDNSLADPEPVCDLPVIDLQRWVMITVVLNGRTIDVYLDGKLARSCSTTSGFKVDGGGVTPVILGGGGAPDLDGSISGLSVCNYAMNPGQIYRTYSVGPKANQTMLSWAISLFTGQQAS